MKTSAAPFASTAPVVPWWRRALRAFRGRPVQPSVDWCLEGALFTPAAARALRRAYALAHTEDRPVEARDLLRALKDSPELGALLADETAHAAVDAALAAADAGALGDGGHAHDAVTRLVVAARNRAGRLRMAVGSRALLAALWTIEDPLAGALAALERPLARELAPPAPENDDHDDHDDDDHDRARPAGAAPALIAALAAAPALAPLWRALDARLHGLDAVPVPPEVAAAVARDPRQRLADVARMRGAPLARFAAVAPHEVLAVLAHGVRGHDAVVDDDGAPAGDVLALVVHDDDVTRQAFVVEALMDELGLDAERATAVMYAVHESAGGSAVAAMLPRAVAIDAVNRVHERGRARGEPLRLTLRSAPAAPGARGDATIEP